MDALHGLRVLVAGEDARTLDAARSGLAAEGAVAQVCEADPAAVAAAVRGGAPDAVLALDGSEDRLRAGLDPLGLEVGPPVVPVLDVVGPRDPFDATAARRLRALVQLHTLRERAAELEGVIAAQAVSRRRELETAQLDGLRRLALAAEYRDDNTHEHTQRVGHLAALLAREVGLGDRMVWLVREAAPLHDLGKIAIPDSILLKPGRLSGEEYEVVKTHALLGARVLAGADSELLEVAERIVRHHHERWDGDGYPDGLAGEAIPVVARLAAVADVFDVLVHERPYKDSWSVEAAAEEIRKGSGTQFDPAVVEAFDALGPAAWRSEVQPV
jgi:putative nucleotidyltransferase with HDIG domain